MTASAPPSPPAGLLASFRIKAYRRLWAADLFSTWGIEMEVVILAWYVLVQTDSAFLVSVIGSLRFGGTLLAPAAGVLADRVSRRTLLIGLRVSYAVMAASLAFPALAGVLPIEWVFVVAGISGLVRPSEMILRQTLIADSVPGPLLTGALGFGRTTMESARVAGPLIGAALYSAFGLGLAYVGITAMFLVSVIASVLIPPISAQSAPTRARPLEELLEGLRYLRADPMMMACMLTALLVNMTAFPVTFGLLPVMARDVFGTDENGLARMIALVAAGAVAGSVLVATVARGYRPQRMMVVSLMLWHVLILGFVFVDSLAVAYVVLFLMGLATTSGMVPLAVLLLGRASPQLRGRVMGVRMLAVYGLPIGLMAAGALIEWVGIRPTLTLFGAAGLVAIAAVAWRYRAALATVPAP